MIALGELAVAVGGIVSAGADPNTQLAGFAYRLRDIVPGMLYVAAPGVGDGVDRAGAAVERGAVAVLTEEPLLRLESLAPVVVVPDVELALLKWAEEVLRAWKPRSVLLVGKWRNRALATLTREVLSSRFRVTASGAGWSPGRLAVPSALASMDRGAEVAVFDLATDARGAMLEQVRLASPEAIVLDRPAGEYGVAIDGLSTALDGLGWEGARNPPTPFSGKERGEGEEGALGSGPGPWALVVPAGVGLPKALCERSRAVLTYGVVTGDLRYSVVECGPAVTEVQFQTESGRETARLPVHSAGLAEDCAAAVGVGLQVGIGLSDAVAALEQHVPGDGEARLVRMPGGAWVVDATDVGTPLRAMEDLATYAAWNGYSRRYVVLGDLSEWCTSDAAPLAGHIQPNWDGFFGLGDQAATVAHRLRQSGFPASVYHLPSDLAPAVRTAAEPKDLIVVLGGAESGMAGVVRRLEGLSGPETEQPSEAPSRLARPDRPTWVEVDVQAVAHNTRLIREAAGVPLMAVLKADAYGHGAVRMAEVVLANGVDAIAVACLSEGRELRRAGISQEILILGYTPPWQAHEAVREGLSCTLYDWETARALNRAGRDLGRPAVVHVKVDTGLSRLGLTSEEAPAFLDRLRSLAHLEVRGVFTHFGSADAADLSHAQGQLRLFRELLTDLQAAGLRPPVAHAANTAAAMRLPEARFDMVRAAIGLYGLDPSPEGPLPAGFQPTFTFKTTVAQVKWIEPGRRVGYGRAHTTAKPTLVAVLPVGYGDGFRRTPHNWGHVLVGGHRCPILGNVCMDQAMVDITDVDGVMAGDEAVLIGRQGDATITVDEVAANLGTIVYEVVAAIMARVPRLIR